MDVAVLLSESCTSSSVRSFWHSFLVTRNQNREVAVVVNHRILTNIQCLQLFTVRLTRLWGRIPVSISCSFPMWGMTTPLSFVYFH
jgi:hypothetical protein